MPAIVSWTLAHEHPVVFEIFTDSAVKAREGLFKAFVNVVALSAVCLGTHGTSFFVKCFDFFGE